MDEKQKMICLYNGDEHPLEDSVWVDHVGMYFPKGHSDVEPYCEEAGEFLLTTSSEVCFDNHQEGYSFKDICVYGVIDSNGGEGYFSESADYVYSGPSEQYFINSDVANDNDCYWCDDCSEYICDGNHFDSCGDFDDYGDDYSPFENATMISKKQIERYSENTSSSYYKSYNEAGCIDVHFRRTFGMQYTFGVELETNSGRVTMNDACDNNLNMNCVSDGSITGGEYNTGVLHGDAGVNMVENICNYLMNECTVNQKCGLHVHIGGANFNRRFSILALKLAFQLEYDMFAMLPPSRQSNSFAKKMPEYIDGINLRNGMDKLARYVFSHNKFDKDHNKKTRVGRYPSERYGWINLVKVNTTSSAETVEFRQHSGTLDFNKVYNWLLICMSFVHYVENQPRQILKGGVKLHDVLRYSLGDKAEEVLCYIQNRALLFGNNYDYPSLEYSDTLEKMNTDVSSIKDFLKKIDDEKQVLLPKEEEERAISV